MSSADDCNVDPIAAGDPMPFVISFFSTLVAPVLLLIAWLICLWHLRSMTLFLLTALLLIFVTVTTESNFLLLTRNPYAMLTVLAMVTGMVLLMGQASKRDYPYLIAAGVVLLTMIAALHGWRMFLWQSGTYFTDTSPDIAMIVVLVISSMTLLLPMIGWLSRKRLRWGAGIIVAVLIICMIAGNWSV